MHWLHSWAVFGVKCWFETNPSMVPAKKTCFVYLDRKIKDTDAALLVVSILSD
jgi:hypothetical protein